MAQLFGSFGDVELEVYGVAAVFVLWPAYCAGRIGKRVGYRDRGSIFILAFLLGFILFWWFAIAEWPNERRARLDAKGT